MEDVPPRFYNSSAVRRLSLVFGWDEVMDQVRMTLGSSHAPVVLMQLHPFSDDGRRETDGMYSIATWLCTYVNSHLRHCSKYASSSHSSTTSRHADIRSANPFRGRVPNSIL